MLHINSSHLPELQPHHLPQKDLRKRAKFLLKCKDVMWKRFTAEYIQSLQKSQAFFFPSCLTVSQVGDVFIIQDNKKNWNQWKLRVVTQLIKGRITSSDQPSSRQVKKSSSVRLSHYALWSSHVLCRPPHLTQQPRSLTSAQRGMLLLLLQHVYNNFVSNQTYEP